MLASGFVHPGLLAGLALIALPILIHLLSRRQFRRMDWAATYFLLQAERENRRRTQFEQWLLLALRCLAVALLALLVARPFVQPGLISALLGESSTAWRIVVVDDSASLAYRGGTERNIDELRNASQRLVRWLAEGASGDDLMILRTSAPDEPLVTIDGFGTTRLREAEEALTNLQAAMVPANPTATLTRVAGLVEQAGTRQLEVYLLSDFQRSDWLAQGTAAFESLQQLDPKRIRVAMMAVGTAPRANLAVADVRPMRSQVLAGFPAVYQADVVNHTSAPLEDLLLTRSVNDVALTPVTVEQIEPGERKTVSFEVTMAEPGPAVLRVAVAPRDGFPMDDGFNIVADVRPALRVGLVNGEPSPRASEDEVHFVRNALAPPGAANSGIQVEVLAPGEVSATPLQRFDAILYCNAVPDPAATDALRRYVQGGGGLALVPGDQVGDGADWNRLLGSAGLLPAKLTGRVVRAPQDQAFRLHRSGEHQLVAMLPEPAGATRGVRVGRFVALQPNEQGSEVLAAFSDAANSPAIVTGMYGTGRVVLFATALDLEWNDWPRAVDGSYVVTMLELVYGLAPRGVVPPALASGNTLEVMLPPSRYELRGLYRSPDHPSSPEVAGRVVEVDGEVDAPARLVGPVADRLGLYTVELESTTTGVIERQVAVNLPARETDLASASAAELARALGGVPHRYVEAREALLGDELASRRELWPTILAVLFVTLLLEQTLAWWFGRPGRKTLSALWQDLWQSPKGRRRAA